MRKSTNLGLASVIAFDAILIVNWTINYDATPQEDIDNANNMLFIKQ